MWKVKVNVRRKKRNIEKNAGTCANRHKVEKRQAEIDNEQQLSFSYKSFIYISINKKRLDSNYCDLGSCRLVFCVVFKLLTIKKKLKTNHQIVVKTCFLLDCAWNLTVSMSLNRQLLIYDEYYLMNFSFGSD